MKMRTVSVLLLFFSIGCASSAVVQPSDPAIDAMHEASGEWSCEGHPFVTERSAAHSLTVTRKGRAALACVGAVEDNECYCLLARPFPTYKVQRVPEHGRVTMSFGIMCGGFPVVAKVELELGASSLSVSHKSTDEKIDCTRAP